MSDPHPSPSKVAVGSVPTAAVGGRFLACLALSQTGAFIAFVPLFTFFLPLQAASIDPQNAAMLVGKAALFGGVVAAVANIVWGLLSDRTRTRFGRRRPWVLGGLIATIVCGGLFCSAGTAFALIVSVGIFQVALNAMFGPMNALLPDMVPDRQKGLASALLGVAQPVATLLTALIATTPGISVGEWFVASSILVACLVLPLVVFTREPVLQTAASNSLASLRAVTDPDFVATFVSRLLIQVGITMNTLYLLLYVQASSDIASRFEQTRPVFGWLLAANTAMALVFGLVGGLWSDRLNRRKIFVTAGGLLLACGLLMMVFMPQWPGPLVGQLFVGAGLGLYFTVDLALVAQILPERANAGRDLGLLNLTNTLPQIAAPTLALVLLGWGHGAQLAPVFFGGAAFVLAGTLAITRIRGVA